jgi:hypothetical protein
VIALVTGVCALLALLAPSSALAGTFSWSLPNDFTTTPPGSNPEHKYGAPSWSYHATGSLSFSSNADLFGHPGWSDGSGDFIADTGSALVLNAVSGVAGGHSVTVAWTNPFPFTQTVTVADSITADPAPSCLAVGAGVSQSPGGTSVTLGPGKSLAVTVSGGVGATPCTASGTLSITATSPGPTVSLNSPGTGPLHTASPSLTGTASTGFSDSRQVTVDIYPGTNTSAKPARSLTAAVGSEGQFGVRVQPGLPDGEYTAVASQASGIGTGESPAVRFQIKVHPPALTLEQPPRDVWIGRHNLEFSGRAGDEFGDSSTVALYLYRGKSAAGSPIGTRDLRAHRGRWATRWQGLPLGYYTAVAVQSDDAGHTTRTLAHTFRLVAHTTAFGPSVTVAGGLASIAVGCLAPSSKECSGTVLVVTKRSFRTTPGGPSGPLQVLFKSVRIPGGTMAVISSNVPRSVLGVLRRLGHVEVRATANLSRSRGASSASLPLRAS